MTLNLEEEKDERKPKDRRKTQWKALSRKRKTNFVYPCGITLAMRIGWTASCTAFKFGERESKLFSIL